MLIKFSRSRTPLLLTAVVVILCSVLTSSQASVGDGRLRVEDTLPGEAFIKFYLFNVTNPDEFEANEEKPALEEVGPFIFRETTEKFNVTHSVDGSTTTYSERKYYEFLPELSLDPKTGDPFDINQPVNFINVPLMSFGSNLARVPLIGVNLFKSLVKAKETIIKRNIPIKDFFYGYDAEAFLKIIEILLAGEPVPPQFEGGTFGLLKDRNASEGGPYEVGTGQDAKHEYGQIVSWKEKTKLDWWTRPGSDDDEPNYCNMINGSVETSTNLDTLELQHYHLYTWMPDACRSLKYTYSEEQAELDSSSIVGLKYKFDPHMLQSIADNPDNACFCPSPGEGNKNCLRAGAMDLGPCRQNAPFALTYPHFLDADPYYLEMIKSGIQPDRAKHESYMIVEPKTGTILQDVKRFQLNVRLKPLPAFTYLKNLPNMLFPVLSTEKVYTLDKDSLATLAQELNSRGSGSNANLIESWQNEKVSKSQRNQSPNAGGSQDGPPKAPSATDEQAHVHGHHGGNTGGTASTKFSFSSALFLIIIPVIKLITNQ